MKTFFLMCFEFFKTGLFAIGGGLASIPFLQEMSVKYEWFSLSDLSTMIAVSESTPGPIGINMATYVGNQMFGFAGGLAATLSLVCPSVIIICIVARVLDKFRESAVIKGVFNGLRPAVVGFIISSVIGIYLSSLFHADSFSAGGNILDFFNMRAIILFLVLLAFYKFKPKTHPVVLIAITAVVGILLPL